LDLRRYYFRHTNCRCFSWVYYNQELPNIVPLEIAAFSASTILSFDPEEFYVTEQAGDVSNVGRPIMKPVTGWRAILKKK